MDEIKILMRGCGGRCLIEGGGQQNYLLESVSTLYANKLTNNLFANFVANNLLLVKVCVLGTTLEL